MSIERAQRAYDAQMPDDDPSGPDFDEAVERETQALLAPGGACYPFGQVALAVAIDNAEESELATLIESLAIAEHRAAGAALSQYAMTFWRTLAQERAERYVRENWGWLRPTPLSHEHFDYDDFDLRR